jgi:hypothetical protein
MTARNTAVTEIEEKMLALARLLCEEVSIALREAEGSRYFLTGEQRTSWEEFNEHCETLKFAESNNFIPDIDTFLLSKEMRKATVSTVRNSLSEQVGPRGTFIVAKFPPLLRDEFCPEEQVQEASCDIQGGYPHVRCVVTRDKFAQKQCHATLDLAYYRVS